MGGRARAQSEGRRLTVLGARRARSTVGPAGRRPRRPPVVAVYGNGISGLEIASDLAPRAPVISAFRKPRYVIQKVVDGVSSDWQWYTLFGAIERRALPADQWSRRQRERILRVAGDPADVGAPKPSEDVLAAGVSLCQDYLTQVRDGSIVCRPGISSVDARTVRFDDGSSETVDAVICATGYDVDIPYLSRAVRERLGPDLALYQRTFTPTCRASASSGSSRPRPVPAAARASGALDRRGVERRGDAPRRASHAPRCRPASAAAGRPQRTGADARDRAPRRS